jgi:hypothetical protein
MNDSRLKLTRFQRTASPGRRELTMPPRRSTATHSETDGHEIAVTQRWGSIDFGEVHAPGPAVGSDDTRISAWLSVTMHQSARGHDTLNSRFEPARSNVNHADGPPPGSLDTDTRPPSPTATHSVVVGHVTLFSARGEIAIRGAQLSADAAPADASATTAAATTSAPLRRTDPLIRCLLACAVDPAHDTNRL